jgi:V/A-type H+-transporting ATPase subunit E
MANLAEILEEEVLAEIGEILEEAQARSDRIVRDAKAEAAARLEAAQRENEAEERASAQRSRSAGELNVATARLDAKGQVIECTRRQSVAAIEKASSRPDYAEILRALANEALGAIEDPVAVSVNPDDIEKLRDWAARKGLELRTEPDLRLGVRIANASGKAVENTLPERLNRAWDAVVSDVAAMLWPQGQGAQG